MLNKLFSGIFGHFLMRSVIISTLTGLLLLIIILKYFDDTANSLAADQGHTLTNSTLAAISDNLSTNDYASVVDYALNMMKVTPNILSIICSQRNGGELIVKNNKWNLNNKTLPYYKMRFQNTPNNMHNTGYYMKSSGFNLGFSDTLTYSSPIYISGKDWGVLTFIFSTNAYSTSIKFFYQIVIFFIFISILTSSFLFWLSSKRIRKQITSFSAVAKTLSDGNLQVKAQETAIGEIGSLGKAINNMSSVLAEKNIRLFQLAQIVEQTNDVFILFNCSYEIIFINDAVIQLLGYESIYFIGMPVTEFITTLNLSSYDLMYEFKWMLSNGLHSKAKDVVITRKNQSIVNVEIRLETIINAQEQYFLIVLNDVTERKLAEAEIRIAATAFEAQEGMIVTDAHNVILRVNHAFTTITGYSEEDSVGLTPHMLSSGEHDAKFYEKMWHSINNKGVWESEVWNRRKNGEVYPENLTITAVKDDSGTVTNYVATITDITLRKDAEEKIQHLAFYDPLTNLPNRRLVLDRLNQALTASIRSGQRGALLFLDLDHFKTLNDTLGHDMGDVLLKQVAARLTTCVREDDTVARLGGDEFVVLLENLSEQTIEAAAYTEDIAEKILLSLNQPYQLNTHAYHSTPSIGATLFHGHKQTSEELLKQADIAMYQSKSEGRNTLRFFDPIMQEVITSRANMEHELHKAIEQNQFELYYQIQVSSSGQALGAEALIRWPHPERGMIFPANFIPLSEEVGLILPIGQWVFDAACSQLNSWQQNSLTSDLVLSINVSAKQFFQTDFLEQALTTIQRHQINPARLKLELTESMLVEKIDDIITKMDTLNKIGVLFSLDDFGTGYSSMQYLKRLPIHQVKIDQSFVRDIVVDKSDRAIVRAIITLAHSLGIDVIAEGVETIEQKQFLLENGCMHYQGYLFSKPVPIDEFEALLKKC